MLTQKEIFLRLILVFTMFLGFIGWILPIMGGNSWSPRTELPNTEVHGILVDQGGNIYCFSSFYGRIQKYHPDGTFDWGFEVADSKYATFEITGEGQLCVIHPRLTADFKATLQHRDFYDGSGNLIRSEETVTDRGARKSKMENIVTDSAGNLYIWKGFLFPRVIKEIPSGEKTVLISTPVWLWFLQGPFPTFGFFAGSMGFLIFLSHKEKLKVKSAVLFDPKRIRGFIILFLCTLGVLLLIIAFLVTARPSYLFLFVFSIFSFIATALIALPLTVIYGILYQWRAIRIDYQSWKNSTFGATKEIQEQARQALKSLNDPFLRKLRTVFRKTVISLFWLWLALLIAAIGVVLYLDYTGDWRNIVERIKGT